MRTNTTDENLAQAAGNGDRDAFAILLERHYDRLFAMAYRLTGARAEAEDLTHDICLALPRKLAGFRADARFSTWLYRVAVNAAHDRRRRSTSHDKAAQGWSEVELARSADQDAEHDRLTWLAQAMSALKPELRDTAVLILGEGLTQAAAGAALGVPEGTVAWRMSEVKRHLTALAEKDPDR